MVKVEVSFVYSGLCCIIGVYCNSAGPCVHVDYLNGRLVSAEISESTQIRVKRVNLRFSFEVWLVTNVSVKRFGDFK